MGSLLVILSALAPGQAVKDAAKKAEAIRGEWKCTALVIGGEKQPAEAARKLRLVVKGRV